MHLFRKEVLSDCGIDDHGTDYDNSCSDKLLLLWYLINRLNWLVQLIKGHHKLLTASSFSIAGNVHLNM